MGEFREITNPKTLAKVKLARDLMAQGYSEAQIADRMNLSVSRIKELIRGVNWVSKA